MLTPLDIQNAAFHRSFRGYNEEEVDDFLDKVFLEYEALYRENQELKKKLEASSKNPKVISSLTAGPTNEDALAKSSQIIADAQRQANEILARAQEQVAREKARLEELKQQRRMFKEQFQAMLQTFFHILKNYEDGEVPDQTLVLNRLNQDWQAEVSAGVEKE
ncbi:MAG: DivIVA domain-containing protein [Firmicutes bacterium]|nr:DivIVA domain-containing protein [Bacillota bacterium]